MNVSAVCKAIDEILLKNFELLQEAGEVLRQLKSITTSKEINDPQMEKELNTDVVGELTKEEHLSLDIP